MDTKNPQKNRNHPLNVKKNYIVVDNLEYGTMEVFEHINADTPLHIQHQSNHLCVMGVILVGKISISYMQDIDILVIDEICCEEGHEELRDAMIDQVYDFVRFHGREDMVIVEPSKNSKVEHKEECTKINFNI